MSTQPAPLPASLELEPSNVAVVENLTDPDTPHGVELPHGVTLADKAGMLAKAV